MKRSLSTIFLASLITLSINFGFFLVYQEEPKEVRAGTDENVSGWAWSENIGWVSFNNTSGGGTIDYGVNIGSDGVFSGYAWSENIGWISFNTADLSGCPSGVCRAEINLETGEVSGWARILNLTDGWIHLKGSNYGISVDINPSSPTYQEFSGWAWGDTAIGWLSFNCENWTHPDYKVKTSFSFNRAPTAHTLSVDQGNYCTAPLHPTFSWTFSDPDNDNQGAYQIQVDNNFGFTSPEIDSGKVYSASNSYSPSNPLSYNTTYYWRLKVWDEREMESDDWIYPPSPEGNPSLPPGDSFTTPDHAYPAPDFTWSPASPSIEEFVQFCAIEESGVCSEDPSTCYDISGEIPSPSCTTTDFLWTFPPGTEFASGSSATVPNPEVRFTTTGDKNVYLNITDDVGSCTRTRIIGVSYPLPKWKEIEP